MITAKNAVLDSFGVKIEEATIEQVLRYGTVDIGKPYLDCITAVQKKLQQKELDRQIPEPQKKKQKEYER